MNNRFIQAIRPLDVVVSIGLTAPPEFTVTGSPVINAGNLVVDWASQAQNKFLASPDGMAGLPSFRSILAADLPAGIVFNTLVDAKGDLIAATAADTLARLAVGSNGQVLTADSGETTGIKWATPAAGVTDFLGLSDTPNTYVGQEGKLVRVNATPDALEFFTLVPTANGGLGVALADPNADRMLFWDDSAGQYAYLQTGAGISISGTTLTATGSGDVNGPASSLDNNLIVFNGTTGKLIKGAGSGLMGVSGNDTFSYNGKDMLKFNDQGSASTNFFGITAGNAGNPLLRLVALGSMTDVTIGLFTKGTGGVQLLNAFEQIMFEVLPTAANAPNGFQFRNTAAGSTPTFQTRGSDANVGLRISSKGTGNIDFFTDTDTLQAFQLARVASAVNYLSAKPSITTVGPTLSALGSDANIDLLLASKGTGVVKANGTEVAIITDNRFNPAPSSALNYPRVNAGANAYELRTPANVRSDIGAAASGANSDITSLSGLTTDLSIAQGGTGQSTSTAAFDALSPTTTLGDTIYHGASGTLRLAGNITTTRKFLRQTGTGAASAAPVWDTVTINDVSPLTTKGDLHVYTTVDTRLAVGANGTVLTANSAAGSGLQWTAPTVYGDVDGPAGCDDNELPSFNGTTGKLLQANSNILVTAGTLTRNADASDFTISGGNAAATGANIQLFGSSHATIPGEIRFRASSTQRGKFSTGGYFKVANDGGYIDTAASTHEAVQGSTTATNDVLAMWHKATAGGNRFLEFGTEGTYTVRGSIRYNRGAGLVDFNTTSDESLKVLLSETEKGWGKKILSEIKVSDFIWTEFPSTIQHGPTAHQLHSVYPQAVSADNDQPWSVDFSKLTVPLISGWQNHESRLSALESCKFGSLQSLVGLHNFANEYLEAEIAGRKVKLAILQ